MYENLAIQPIQGMSNKSITCSREKRKGKRAGMLSPASMRYVIESPSNLNLQVSLA